VARDGRHAEVFFVERVAQERPVEVDVPEADAEADVRVTEDALVVERVEEAGAAQLDEEAVVRGSAGHELNVGGRNVALLDLLRRSGGRLGREGGGGRPGGRGGRRR